ncbi:MAG: TIGR00282 family metallophosphoesterase [Phycisphaerales bacterium]|nr:TIGR00282 family metallophosphoesterase [Phycisphaerales bacterium]
MNPDAIGRKLGDQVRLLCIGDIVGGPGRRVLAGQLPRLMLDRAIDCNIVNVENAAAGSGLTPPMYDQFVKCGVHLMTLGDHVYRRRDIIPVLEKSDRIVRPANLAPGAPGREFAVWETSSGVRVAVLTLLGRMYMRMAADCPFRAADRVLAVLPPDVKTVVVDFHAETTSEKIAMGWHLDGRVTAMVGTHTHIPTADERVLPGGTAYITDMGMTGPYDSVLGRRKDRVLSAMVTSVPAPFDVAEGDVRLCGVIIEADPATGRATSIERVRVDDIGSATGVG